VKEAMLGHDDSALSAASPTAGENALLERMYADLALMHHGLKDVVDQKLWLRSVVSWSLAPLWSSTA